MEAPGWASGTTPVPRDTIEGALAEELGKDGLTSLAAVAAEVGLSNKRRLYNGFHAVRRAIVEKNKRSGDRNGRQLKTLCAMPSVNSPCQP